MLEFAVLYCQGMLKVKRLIDALRDLTQFYRDSLDVDDLKTISEVMVKCREIL
jgi:hypothetical protein